MDALALRKILQDVKAADLVAAIGRIRHTVRQEQDVAHQPSPLEMSGPTWLATQSGSFFHTAT